MASILAYMAAGAAKGLGDNMLLQAKEAREERLRKLDDERQDRRDQTNRDFQSSEAVKSRDYQSLEAQKQRDYQSLMGGDPLTLEDGTTGVRRGDKVTPLTGPDGKPVKAMGGAKDKSAEVTTAEWLIQQGVAKTPAEAWEKVRGARSDPEKSRASIFKTLVTTATKDSMGNVDMEKVTADALKQTDIIMRHLNEADGDAPADAPPSTVKTEQAPPAPRDFASREKGKVYTSSTGKQGRWTGTGWEML